jgi:outer membrane autotransporter protein
MDHRFTDAIVAGVMAGYSNKSIDFDVARSVVDASMRVEGHSLIAYGQWDSDNLYVNGSIGGQWLDLDTRRRILYPSFNPRVESVDSTALSTTSSSAFTATFGAGYEARLSGMSFGPYLKAEYQDITIDGFTEGGPQADGFAFAVGGQKIKSFDTALGVRAQRVFLPTFGVVVPFLRAEYHKEFENDARAVSAVYTDSVTITTAGFSVPTDDPDDDFVLLAAGLSAVWPHGLQGFLQYQQIVGLDRYSDRVITAGLRYEL